MQNLYGILKNKPFSYHLLALFILMLMGVFVSGLTGRMLVYVFWGLDIALEEELNDLSNPDVLNAYRLLLLLNHLGLLILPTVLWAWLCGENKKEVLSLNKKVFFSPAFLAVLIFVFCIPFANLLLDLNLRIPLPDAFAYLTKVNEENIALSSALVYNESSFIFFINLIVFAIVPAISEELLFRGFLQKKLSELYKNPHAAVFISAFVFSLFHMEVYYFFPRLFLGLLLGYLFFYSGNLKYSIWAHFLNNIISLLMAWLIALKHIEKPIEDFGTNNSAEIIMSIAGCLIGLICLWRFKKYFE